MREVGEKALEKFNFEPGNVHEKGVKESEVLILFFNDNENTLKEICDRGANLTITFCNELKTPTIPLSINNLYFVTCLLQ